MDSLRVDFHFKPNAREKLVGRGRGGEVQKVNHLKRLASLGNQTQMKEPVITSVFKKDPDLVPTLHRHINGYRQQTFDSSNPAMD